jgi:hypothetical protein
VLLQSLLNPQFSSVIAKPSQSTVFWCYRKAFSIHSFLVLLQILLNPQFSGVIAKPSQSTVSFLVLLQSLLNPHFSVAIANPSQSTVFCCYCKTFSIHSFLVLLSLPTLEHTAIL